MNWTLWGDFAFMAGGICSLAFLVWGAWLCIPFVENSPHGKGINQPGKRPRFPARKALVALFYAALIAAPLVRPDEACAEEAMERGLQAYQDTKYEYAMGQLAVAAEKGNGRAQEILGFMHLHGPRLFGAGVPEDASRSMYWLGRAAGSGQEAARHVLCSRLPRCANRVSAGTVEARPGLDGCAGDGNRAHTAYLILDQSERSAVFKEAMKNVARPDLVAVNFVRGDFSGVGPNAERHPLVYVFEGGANARQVRDSDEFVRVVNQLSACSRS